MIWLADLLGALLCLQVFLFGGRDIVTAGLVQYSVAGVLLSWAATATLVRRKPPAEPGNWVTHLMRVPRLAETVLLTAYICAATSWLNVLAGHDGLRFSTAASLSSAAVCTILFYGLARPQDLTTGVLKDRIGRKRIKATVAWVVLMVAYALPLVGGAAVTAIRNGGHDIAPELTSPELSLAWLSLCSLFLGVVLFRPWVMRLSLKAVLPTLLAFVTVLGLAAALEQIWRRDWYLYTLTSIIFLGTALGVWRLVDTLCAANVQGTGIGEPQLRGSVAANAQ